MRSIEPKLALRLADMTEELAGVGSWWMDATSEEIRWSPNMFKIFGLAPGNIPSLDYAMQYVHPDDRPAADSNLAENLLGGASRSATRIVQPSGVVRYVEGRNACEFAHDGSVLAVYGTVHDVTGRVAAQTALAESEARYRMLAEVSSDVVLQVNGEDVIQYVSPSIRRYGWTPEQMLGLTGATFIHPDDVERVLATVEMFSVGQGIAASRDRSYRIRQADGSYVWIEANSSVVRNVDGSVRAIVCQLRDISERRAAQQALAASEARYRLLAENARDVTACCQPDGTFTFLTAAIRSLLGYEVHELIGRKAYEFIHPDDRASVQQAFVEHMKRGGSASPLRYEYRAIAKDGHEVWLEANPIGVFDEATGALVEVQDILRDITARKTMDRQLIAANEAVETANAVKAEFLANISHELRTPLTAIIGYSELLGETSDLTARGRHLTERVESASRSLLSLVNGILDFSRLEAGRVTIAPRVCSPAQIARECLDLLALSAEAKGVRLEYSEADRVPLSVLMDPHAYRQILVNLIGNAVKFTDAGSVLLTVDFNVSTGQLLVSVKDTGIGISSNEIGKLFRRFSQVEGTSTRKHGGVGLGLAICKGLVDALGGDLSAASTPGVGSVFSFRIPTLPAGSIPAMSEIDERPQAGLRILIADDNAAIREVARTVLESCGSEVTEAADGGTAIELATSQPFDLILLDLLMPSMTGREVAMVLRGRRGPNANVPIIAFTASSEALDEAFIESTGFDAVLSKPVVVRDLLTIVARCTHCTARGYIS